MTTTGNPLDLALTGICPVEASAGTGKTFAIATLYLRFVLEQAYTVDQIVVATFTRAAAAELATRLRERLVTADRLLAGAEPGVERDDDSGAERATRAIIAAQLAAGVDIDTLRRRARNARLALDTACIGTLHGFCHRALAEFGFDTGQTLRPPELIDDVRALEDEIVRDFWRRGSADAATAGQLAATWGTPDALATQVRDAHWRDRAIDPPAVDDAAAKLLLAARAYLAAELPRRLAARNVMSHDTAIDQLAAALASPRRTALVATLRQRWKVALVDEFQDTDSAQWAIVRALFADTALVIVGDPKQAIYGFRGGDVYAWRQALAEARAANPAAARLQLTRSFRSGAGLCTAFNALFSQPADTQPRAFIESIEHPDIAPDASVRERAVLQDGQPLAALQVWWLDPESIDHADGRLPSKGRAEGAIEQACVAWIANTLRAPGMQLRGKHGACEPLQAKHVAVLVATNRQALALQAALGRAGIAATCNLKSSVYASAEADDVALLLAAIAAPDDTRRARAAHASVLLGRTASELAPLPDAAGPATDLLEAVAGWADDVRRHGPAAWLRRLLQTAAPGLLALPDGERRVANYLQIGELLQDLATTSFGGADLAARFARARVEASDDADAERLRLDTDAQAVTIATVHAAKGLEYDVVLVPYAALASAPSHRRPPVPLHWYHDDANRGRVAIGTGADATSIERATLEDDAEAVRKLYVAVTRASALCVLPYGPTQGCEFSALFHVLQKAGRAQPLPADAAGCRTALDALRARANGAVAVIDNLPAPRASTRKAAAPRQQHAALHARPFDGTHLERDWTVWSFSRLVRGGHGNDTAPGAGDRAGIDAAATAPTLAGPRFGTAVHAIFEHADFAAWKDTHGVPATQRELVERCLRDEGLPPPGGMALADAANIAGACVNGALNAGLPCGVRLCDVAPAERRPEIEFHLSLAPARTAALLDLLHAHGYLAGRTGFNAATLNGLMTGKIDLTFRHAGRFHIIDWKTNLCAAYDAAALAAEIARHDYDLQWLIYTLALHRWLRQRLADYAYARHVGEVYYLFVRGMRAGGGIHRDAPPAALVDALDRLFGGGTT